jgi:hypothetical protein
MPLGYGHEVRVFSNADSRQRQRNHHPTGSIILTLNFSGINQNQTKTPPYAHNIKPIEGFKASRREVIYDDLNRYPVELKKAIDSIVIMRCESIC